MPKDLLDALFAYLDCQPNPTSMWNGETNSAASVLNLYDAPSTLHLSTMRVTAQTTVRR